jgi:cytochrome P450
MTNSVYPPIPRSRADLSHLPGEDGLPIIGQTVEVLARPTMLPQRLWQRYGAVSRGNAMFENCVHLLGPDANRFVLADRDRNFSADGGWQPLLGRLFPRGLMLRDGADHRKLMQFAFKKKALPEDLASMQPMIRASIDAWPTKLKFYPAIKGLTLDIAAQVFLGLSLGRGAQRINTAFVNVVAVDGGGSNNPARHALRRGLAWPAAAGRLFRARSRIAPQCRNE